MNELFISFVWSIAVFAGMLIFGVICFLAGTAHEERRRDLSNDPPITRCKSCIYFEHWYGDKGICSLWDDASVFEDGFCNYGETEAGHVQNDSV